jgi:hypothetical protein
MTPYASTQTRVRVGAIVAVALAAAIASVVALTGVATGAAAQRQQGFGAAARVAVGQAAAKLAHGMGRTGPSSPNPGSSSPGSSK